MASVRKKGFHWVSEEEIIRDHFDLEVAFRRDPEGLCHAVAAALNEMLRDDPYMRGWEWGIEWQNLPGAIQVQVTGMACHPSEVQCPGFFAATSVAEYNEVDAAAKRLKERIHRTLEAWTP